MSQKWVGSLKATALAMPFLVVSAAAFAQPATGPFPEGGVVEIHVGTAPGGTNDMITRLISEHLGKYLPGNPSVVVSNMPGAGGRSLAAYMYGRADRDGTELAVIQRPVSTAPLLEDNLPFRMNEMTWIGTISKATDVCIVRRESPVQSLEDALEQELILAGSGGEAAQVATLERLTGANIRAVIGYEGGAQMMLALERGEVDGRCAIAWESLVSNYPDWIENDLVKPIVQFALTPHPDIPDVPLVIDFARDEADRQALEILLLPGEVGYPLLAPPGLEPEVASMLREAFASVMEDPEFLQQAETSGLVIEPVLGEALQSLVQGAYDLPEEVIARAHELIAAP